MRYYFLIKKKRAVDFPSIESVAYPIILKTSYSLGPRDVIFSFLFLSLWLLCCCFSRSSCKCSPGFSPCSFYSLILCALLLVTSNSVVIFIAIDSSVCLQPWQPSAAGSRCFKIHLANAFQICSSFFVLCPGL